MGIDLDLHIEKLILHDISPRYERRISAAVERELVGLLQHRAGDERWVGDQVLTIEATSIRVDATARPEVIGRQVAANIADTIAGGDR